LLLFFSPWPFITIFFIFLLAFPASEWEEDRIGMTYEDYLDMYLSAYGFSAQEVENILAGNDKFLRGDLEFGKGISKEVEEEIRNSVKDMRENKVERHTNYYDMDEEYVKFFDQFSTEQFDIIVEILKFVKRIGIP